MQQIHLWDVFAGKHLPAGHDSLPSAQKSILASSRRPATTPRAMYAASAVKPPRKGGVKWADGATLTTHPASDRCVSQHISFKMLAHNAHVPFCHIQRFSPVPAHNSMVCTMHFSDLPVRLSVLCSREHAAADVSPAAEPQAAGRVMFDSAGPPGHTPFRSSRFVAPAEDSEELQVTHLASAYLRPLAQNTLVLLSLWHVP